MVVVKRRFSLVVLTLVQLLAVTACFGGGQEELAQDPTATVVFKHEVADLGAVEVLVDGELLRLVEAGELTGALAVPTGTSILSLRNPGAKVSLLSQELDLVDQAYLVAITGSSVGANLSFFTVEAVPPAVTRDEHAVEVVNLRTDGRPLNVFIGTKKVAEAPLDRSISPFSIVTSGDTIIGVSTPEGAPLATLTTSLAEASATMILLGGQGDEVTIEVLTVR